MSLLNDLAQFKTTHKIDGWSDHSPKGISRESADEFAEAPFIHRNSTRSFLIQKILERREATLGPHGEVVVLTGSHTGRAADDKYIVQSSSTEKTIWWENNLKPMGDESFERLYHDVMTYLQGRDETFFTERSIGNPNHYSLNIEFISELPAAALFTCYMFKDKVTQANTEFKILHAPFFEMDPFKYGTRSDTVIATCFDRKCVIIVGTQYAGEIKKSAFSIMNYLAPTQGILPMHAGANQNAKGESFVFFGLSGTGKTTLSTDSDTFLIGDDEHGLSSHGIFNFEGGCYAKTYKLSYESEPEIYKASSQFGSYLENVKMDPETREIDFSDASITENGRASYPLEFLEKRVTSGEGLPPKNIFFLTADAFGVLPPVSLLNTQQALDYFLLGYTAKLAGTEMGVKNPKATFSACFGAPFMLRYPTEYAKLLEEFLKEHKARVWLVNTGWTGGAYGVGQRFPLAITRDIVRAIQNHELDQVPFEADPIFGLSIPQAVRKIDPKVLNPQKSWKSESDYLKAANDLQKSFTEHLAKFRH